ncbi:MAG: hypothetical protein H8E53_10305 [Planctomycetes bacterium]|nr:hypothetical protein [Planctomycetota bacterium]
MAHRFAGFLTKPFKMEELLEVVGMSFSDQRPERGANDPKNRSGSSRGRKNNFGEAERFTSLTGYSRKTVSSCNVWRQEYLQGKRLVLMPPDRLRLLRQNREIQTEEQKKSESSDY